MSNDNRNNTKSLSKIVTRVFQSNVKDIMIESEF